MSHTDDGRREERLARALFEPAGGSEAGMEPEMARELSDLREVERRLASAGRAEHANLLREGSDPELERAARSSLQHLLQGAAPLPARRAGRWPWLALAAALLAVLAWGLWTPDPEVEHGGVALGAGQVELESPVGEVDRYGSFTWRGDLPQGVRYELRIWSADAEALAPPIVEETCDEPRWTPDDPSLLPDALRWEVVARGVGGEVLGRSEQLASRSSR